MSFYQSGNKQCFIFFISACIICSTVTAAVAGINADPVGRVAHHRPERFFPALISPGAEQRCFPKEKCCTEADDAHQKADDRRSGRAALFSPACVSWI